jgi:hypothetical protein
VISGKGGGGLPVGGGEQTGFFPFNTYIITSIATMLHQIIYNTMIDYYLAATKT